MGAAARAHGIELNICACKNADITGGTCNIAGTWSRRKAAARRPQLITPQAAREASYLARERNSPPLG